MSEARYVPFAGESQFDDVEQPMPYRKAVPLIFALSLGLWVAVWQVSAFALRVLFG
jgi:hypothetical protein